MSNFSVTYPVARADLVRYAGASGDFNPIHYSDRVAREMELPGVIAHGMLTMALAARAVGEWVGGPDRVVEFSVRFTSMVVVPDDDTGVEVAISGTASEPDDDGLRTVAVEATCLGEHVLGRATARVRDAHAG
jgi:acyl dehydratase